MTFRGADIRHVWYDEADNIHQHTLDALAYGKPVFAGMDLAKTPSWQVIQPIEITCKACGAEPGERCTKTHRRHGKTGYRGLHFRRKDDARMATEAVRALNPG